jgi:hypothetical protein
MKIRPVEVELYADGRTDMTELIVSFHNLATSPKNTTHYDRTCAAPVAEGHIAWYHFSQLGAEPFLRSLQLLS